MLKKIIISTLAISIIGGGLYLIKNQSNESKTPQMPESPKVETEKFIDESTVPKSKTEEERILVKRDYDKGLEFLKNREISKEEKRKEKLALTIQYIRDLGFEVDEENHTVFPLILVEGKTKISKKGHSYVFNFLKIEELMKLNKNTDKPYLLRLENPIGLDFIVDYTNIADYKNYMFNGSLKNIFLENGKYINSYGQLTYYGNSFKTTIRLKQNEYMPKLTFRYENIYDKEKEKILDGVINLRIDLNQETGEKIYVKPVVDM